MINIKPVSDLRSYNTILKEVTPDTPLFLTKNGVGKYAVIDIEEYEQFVAGLTILEKLKKAEQTKSYSNEEIMKEFGL